MSEGDTDAFIDVLVVKGEITTGEFSRWNGLFHFHTVDPNESIN